ncbi:PKD domain-containing protein [Cystobacter fuscus]
MAQVWQLTAANTITRLEDVSVEAGAVHTRVPSQSVTLFVIPWGSRPSNQPPVAKLTATPTSGNPPLTVVFSSAGSTDSDGTLVTYAWDFGDGQRAIGGATVSHLYTQGGSFTATLTVKDNNGATASASVPIQVTATSLEAPSNCYTQRAGSDVTVRWTDNAQTEEGFIIERGRRPRPSPSRSSPGWTPTPRRSWTGRWPQAGTTTGSSPSLARSGPPPRTWMARRFPDPTRRWWN